MWQALGYCIGAAAAVWLMSGVASHAWHRVKFTMMDRRLQSYEDWPGTE